MNGRNYSIDILKFICAILVVFLHTNWKFQQVFLPFTRCAVPCFFIISGYLLFDKQGINPERLKRNFIHVGKISFWATVFFCIFKEALNIISKGIIWSPTLKEMIAWIFLNENPFGFHLWYLFAYLYVLLVIMIINKYSKWQVLYYMIPLLLMTDLVFGKYSLLLWNWEPPYIYVRNFLFVGLPYFTIGTIIKKKTFDGVSPTMRYLLIGGVLFFTLTTYLEKYFLIYLDKCAVREHYFSSTLLSVCIFLLALSYKISRKSLFSTIGEKDTLHIYIFHPVFITCCSIFFQRVHLHEAYMYVAPFVVLVSTLVFIKCIRKAKILSK